MNDAQAANEWAESHSPPGSHPLHVREAFLAGVKWARENAEPQPENVCTNPTCSCRS